MEEEKLVGLGYFPKELPPAFNSQDLSTHLVSIKQEWNNLYQYQTQKQGNEPAKELKARKKAFTEKYGSSKCWIYSISKGSFSRRPLGIPNPKHFIEVVKLICSQPEMFNEFFNRSQFSASFPVPEARSDKRAVRTFSRSVADLRDKILEQSINKFYQVKLDISKFYPTIYTHAIPWSLLGKEVAKEYFRKDKGTIAQEIEDEKLNAIRYSFGNKLDMAIRNCQDKQSIGIPIGPDTSHIVSELIACKLDEEFNSKYKHLEAKGCRYFDDYYIFVDTVDQADQVIKGMQNILNKYQLELNDKKINVKAFPFSFEDEWVIDLNRFEFKRINFTASLKHYFSLMWSIGEKNNSRMDWVFKYSLKRFEYRTVDIPADSWNVFENLLFKTTLIQPSVLDITTRICLTYKENINEKSKEKLKTLVEKIVKNQTQVCHNFEVAWALWLAKTFELRINVSIAKLVVESKDPASILLLLSMDKEYDLIDGDVNYGEIEDEISEDGLFSEYWILVYQALKNNWLRFHNNIQIENNYFFKILEKKNVNFFDSARQLKTFSSNASTSALDNEFLESNSQNESIGSVYDDTQVSQDVGNTEANDADEFESLFPDISPF